MSAAVVKEYLERFGLADRVITFDQSSATVAEAAADLGCEEARIAKTMAFQVGDTPTLVVIAGDGKVDNPRYKAQFHTKAVMISPDELVDKVGHPQDGRRLPLCGERGCSGVSGRIAETVRHRLPGGGQRRQRRQADH